MLTAGVSHTAILFSFTSSAPAVPTCSIRAGFQVEASSVAHGHAVVQTSHCGVMRRPA